VTTDSQPIVTGWAEAPFGASPWAVAVDPASGSAVVAVRHRPELVAVDGSGRVMWRVGGLAHSPTAVTVVASIRRAVVATHLGGRLEVIELEGGALDRSLPVPMLAAGVVERDGRIYLAGTAVTVIDTARWAPIDTVALPCPATAVATSASAVWLSHTDGVSRLADSGADTIELGPGPQIAGGHPQSAGAWVVDHRGGVCRLIDDNGTVVTEVTVRGRPWHLAVGKNRAYVASSEEGLISVIDTHIGTVVDELRVSRPWSLAIDDQRGVLWVASPLDGVVRWTEVA
jgi:DNA-binding beta-propeller fold protein YncE